MRHLILAAAAVGLFAAAPAVAQGVSVGVGERGVTVRSDDHDGWRERRDWRERRADRWRHRDRDVYVTGSTGCRVVTVRSERPNGDVVVRKMRRCD
ncbi:hypothetical protein [Terrarubrum flagellatum]|uniref:hypothetical protein n=1 Tax=Terrirubrum flagellatum TaxID=2895980 RepID=UPI003144E46E